MRRSLRARRKHSNNKRSQSSRQTIHFGRQRVVRMQCDTLCLHIPASRRWEVKEDMENTDKTMIALFERKGRTRVNGMINWVVSLDEDSFVKWLLLAEKLTICIVMNRSCRHEVTVKEQRPKTLSCSNYEGKNDLCGYTEETKYWAKYSNFGQITKLKTSLWSG